MEGTFKSPNVLQCCVREAGRLDELRKISAELDKC